MRARRRKTKETKLKKSKADEFADVPLELKKLPQWIVHRNKVPRNPKSPNKPAQINNSATWGGFDDAVSA